MARKDEKIYIYINNNIIFQTCLKENLPFNNQVFRFGVNIPSF